MWKKMERWCQLGVLLIAVGAAVISLYSRITAVEVRVANIQERLGRIEGHLRVEVPQGLAERR